jgi:hypothetical protein
MFDLRYHVASLAAVFVALTVGIVVGVGIADRGLLRKGERSFLEERISRLENRLDAATKREALLNGESRAGDTLMNEAYPLLAGDRLKGKRVAVVFVGPVDTSIAGGVERAIGDAGAKVLRVRALQVPIDVTALNRALDGQRQLASYAGRAHVGELGDALGKELVDGGQTPLWNAVSSKLVEEQRGSGDAAVDGVVVARSAKPQQGATARFLSGFYGGVAGAGMPAVGVETSETKPSAVEAFRGAGLSTVDWIDTGYGKLALVWLLAGGTPGAYGVKQTATDGPLPPADSVPAPPPRG